MKFCKDCKHFASNVDMMGGGLNFFCNHEKNIELSLVTGLSSLKLSPEELRNPVYIDMINYCSLEAYWFEAL